MSEVEVVENVIDIVVTASPATYVDVLTDWSPPLTVIAPPVTVVLPPSNGVDDTAVVQSAINAVSAKLAGTNSIGVVRGDSASIYQLPDLTRQSVTIAGCPGTPAGVALAALALKSNVMLSGVNFNCGAVDVSANWPRWKSAIAIADGVSFAGVDRCTFNGNATGNRQAEWPHNAIVAGTASDIWVTNNVCRYFYSSLLVTLGYPAGPAFPARWWVNGNDVRYVQGGAIKFAAGITDVRVVGNVLGTNLSWPIWSAESIFFNDANLNNVKVLVEGNALFDCGPITLKSGVHVKVLHNTVDIGNPNVGIPGYCVQVQYGSDILIAGNSCLMDRVTASAGTVAAGIHVVSPAGAGHQSNGVLITDNTLYLTPVLPAGIEFWDNGNASTNIAISRNEVYGFDNASLAAVFLRGADVAVITDNVIVNGTTNATNEYGIYAGTSTSRNIVTGNQVTNGQIIAAISVDGPPSLICDNTVVNLNQVVVGMRIQGRCVIANNSVTVNGTTQCLWINTNYGCVVTGNHLRATGNYPPVNEQSGTGGPHTYTGNFLRRDTGTGMFNWGSTAPFSIAKNNVGYNPVGTTTVAVPASGTAIAALHFDATFYVTASTSSVALAMSTGGTVTVPANATLAVFLPAGATFTPTYTAAPTWVVQGN